VGQGRTKTDHSIRSITAPRAAAARPPHTHRLAGKAGKAGNNTQSSNLDNATMTHLALDSDTRTQRTKNQVK